MKALTLRQPYAELIVQGKKTMEIRMWNTSFRGEFLIHSAKKIFEQDCQKFKLDSHKLITGKIIGRVTLSGVKKYETLEEFIQQKSSNFDENLKVLLALHIII